MIFKVNWLVAIDFRRIVGENHTYLIHHFVVPLLQGEGWKKQLRLLIPHHVIKIPGKHNTYLIHSFSLRYKDFDFHGPLPLAMLAGSTTFSREQVGRNNKGGFGTRPYDWE
jgi:hypothetical protein